MISQALATGQRFGCNMISAITNKGALAFMVFQGKFEAAVFVQFMTRLLKQLEGRLYLIMELSVTLNNNALQKVGFLGADDLPNYYFSTKYALTDKGLNDVLRRFSNVIEVTGGAYHLPPDPIAREEEAKGLIRVYQDFLKDNEQLSSFSRFSAAVLEPARAALIGQYVQDAGIGISINGDVIVGEDQTVVERNTKHHSEDDVGVNGLTGGENNDLLFGETGTDWIEGRSGQDVIYGGEHDDVIDGGAGDDYLDGGTGVDTYHYRFGEGHDTIVDPDGVNGGRILYIDAEGKYHLLTGGRQSTTDPNLYETLTDDRAQYRLSGSDLIISFDGVEALTVKDAQLPSVNAFLGISLENLGGSLLPQRNNAGDPATWQAVITGGDLDDDLAADSITTRILGGAGDDLLSGRAGETGYVQDIEIFGRGWQSFVAPTTCRLCTLRPVPIYCC